MIDMSAFGRHFKTIPLAHRPAHLKFVHNQLPLGDRKYICSAIKDVNLKVCPCCLLSDEDPSHFLQCRENTERASSLALLLKTIMTDSHPSRPAFAACIELFLRDPNQPVNPNLPSFPMYMRETLDLAIQTQTLIGWLPAIQGYLSIHWNRLSAMSLIDHGKMEPSAGNSRTHKALLALKTFIRSLWLGRNNALHTTKEHEESKTYSMESAEMRHYHSNPTQLPSSDQHYCATPLATLLRSRPSVRRRWLRRVRMARAALLKNGQYQRSITQYIQRTERPRTRLPETTTTTPPVILRAVTTQQRMTSFFPGRPPDGNPQAPSGNPSLPY
jgi:hypothetical protein